jgi:uncharacterized protein (TIGR02453 family)
MPSQPDFLPITAKGFQFLRDLKKHNDRDWFRERKAIFEDEIRKPAETLLAAAGAEARERGLPVYPKEKNSLTRIYRDIRFSSDKTPLHTYVGGMLRGRGPRHALGEVYVHITFSEPFLAAGFWMPERGFLLAWRERMRARPQEFSKLLKRLDKSKLEWIDSYSLKRMPKGFERQVDSPLAKFFRHQVYVMRQPLAESDFGSREIVTRIANFATAAQPLLEYGWTLNHQATRDILE